MRTKVGLWIDHRRAFIVAVTDKGEEMGLIISKVEKQLRRSGDSPLKGPYESQQVPADGSRQRTFTRHLDIYYDAVIVAVREAESILIFGPGKAKDELRKRLETNDLGGRIVGVETVDKLTDRQIAAKVRRRFEEKHSTTKPRRNQSTGSTTRRGRTRS
jgi:DNA-binding transcriptional ArsR family regulator